MWLMDFDSVGFGSRRLEGREVRSDIIDNGWLLSDILEPEQDKGGIIARKIILSIILYYILVDT
jgi:hypothetical protein